MYLAATQPAEPTGFWDRAPQPTAGRLRRVLAQHQYSEDWPMLEHIRNGILWKTTTSQQPSRAVGRGSTVVVCASRGFK